MLADISLYWFTGAIGSSFWPYYARLHGSAILPRGIPPVPNLRVHLDWMARRKKTRQPLPEPLRSALGHWMKRLTLSSRAPKATFFRTPKAGTNDASSHWRATNSKWSIHLRVPEGAQKSYSNARSRTFRSSASGQAEMLTTSNCFPVCPRKRISDLLVIHAMRRNCPASSR
jgi:hypothetical protein